MWEPELDLLVLNKFRCTQVRVCPELKGRNNFGRTCGVRDASHFVARHLLFEKSLLSPKRRYRFTKWVMPKFRFTKSKILIEPAGEVY